MGSSCWRRSAVGFAVLVALLPLDAGAQGRVRPTLVAGSYFPLRVGNAWTFQRITPGGSAEWTAEVTDKQAPPRVFPYFLLSGYFAGAAHPVRSDPFGTVTERSSGYRDFLWYLLGAPVGTTWAIQLPPSPLANPLPDCVSGAKLTLAAREESLQVPAGEFEHVVRVDWVSPCVDAGIVSEWFAPGVGLIRRDEESIAGVVSSVLLHAELGDGVLPRAGYVTTLSLESSAYVNSLMPPSGPSGVPTLAGTLAVASRADESIALAFTGCRSVSISVLNEAGETVLSARGDDGGCCTCRTPVEWDFGHGPLVIPFHFKLTTAKGEPLADGRYAVSATLDTRDAEPLRPAARATIDVSSTH
jgi:hypothetical protein